ncbi:MAG: hypothetical protein COU47_01010 [Candidatus Niyogibacteria bacterium CG10_big_fil_rev_8_21_14_0_10_46_36]|uniref:Fumarylacetoacetase-like C-terminal domain-containing protein n=1 Tax=Candidatus Niyogibacteria bacterium CG10_big_fil_rev_8_21_14_0_10_46_36 TaxID=1974726 RepID=A0A2H0TEL5_9BACT|nr:MAG: hypothetical protein COU47_01010 [Candidatus Niyogibacteria bacterium CG10_big_fil_rev_8_21_14_0_10_46_36]
MTQVHSILEKTDGYMIDTLGFEEHMAQIRGKKGIPVPGEWYKRPYYYALQIEKDKMRHSGETIRFPSFVQKKDYEFEIIGMFLKPIKTTDRKEAIAHVRDHMIFCIFNDASCRDFQGIDMKLPLGVSNSKGIADKGFGDVCAHGRDLNMDVNGVFHMPMRLKVNGEIRARTNFETIYFKDPETGERKNWSFAEVIVFMGRMNQGFHESMLIGSGTVGNGSIADDKKNHPWLKEGDTITMEAEGLGSLTNTIEVVDMPDPADIYGR